MAVRCRILNSTTPFIEPQKEPRGQMKGQLEGHSTLVEMVGSREGEYLKKAIMQGTAEDIGSKPPGQEKSHLFIAQPQDQGKEEFCPSCTEPPYTGFRRLTRRPSIEHSNLSGKVAYEESRTGARSPRSARKRRKRQRQRRQKEGKGGAGRGGDRGRVSSGVPEQESSGSQWPFNPQDEALEYNSSCSSSSSRQSSGVQETQRPGWVRTVSSQPSYGQGPSCSTLPWCPPGPATLPRMSLYSQESKSESHLSSEVNWSLARFGLRGNVCQEDQSFATPFFKEVEREAKVEEEEGLGGSEVNEGILFHPDNKLQPRDYEYKEGRDYSLLGHICSGSYGDVYKAQDKSTGFKCAAKKIPLNQFCSEEAGSWSALNSPRVLEFYGAVREGPSVVLFMALKSGSVGQLLKERGRLPEDLALHYLCQVSEALEHLQSRRVLHLDVKADNVLLSEDGKDTFLSDFGHSERLDSNGRSTKANPGYEFQGTETHMAPEVVKGEPRGAKADVWSSCCFLLHMLNGCHPWIRYYSSPLCLKIANEDPPLREIPSNCKPHTADVIKAGLRKDPMERASATELKEKTARALEEVGGLTSPIKGAYQEPAKAEPMETHHTSSESLPSPRAQPLVLPSPAPSGDVNSELGTGWRRCWRGHVQEEEEGGEADEEEGGGADSLPAFCGTPSVLQSHISRQSKWEWQSVSPLAWELEKEFYLSSLSQSHPPELQEQLLSCLSSDCHLHRDSQERDSGHWSMGNSDYFSSGVFSYSSQPDGQSYGLDWLGPGHSTPPHCFPGVDVGHIATGISDQISERAFSLEKQDGQSVSPEEEVLDSGLWLRCTLAPDRGSYWRWRVKDGVLETLE
ncbi:hypothetical protein AGOR_G00223220 [Albula goreensis]|uniref:Protein kinase domain-containing protein n=1 Tax=Albula goreensis TaxID=1534307 RepID=A0A8T3CLV5_9TELE|nr:hypothetical protein AGOR_G00223220 [Albula goreensis]